MENNIQMQMKGTSCLPPNWHQTNWNKFLFNSSPNKRWSVFVVVVGGGVEWMVYTQTHGFYCDFQFMPSKKKRTNRIAYRNVTLKYEMEFWCVRTVQWSEYKMLIWTATHKRKIILNEIENEKKGPIQNKIEYFIKWFNQWRSTICSVHSFFPTLQQSHWMISYIEHKQHCTQCNHLISVGWAHRSSNECTGI